MCFIQSRGYAAQAAAARADPAASGSQPQVTRLPSGITVATLETSSPVARLAFVHNAGSRYENGDNCGVTHAVRSCLHLGTQNKFKVGISRAVQQIGASLICSTTREHMIYSTEVIRSEIDTAYEILSEVAQYPAFKPHEMEGFKDRLLLEMAYLTQKPEVKMMEGLHEMAFRASLGFSLYMPESSIGLHSSETLKQFTTANFGGSNTLVIGLGVDHQDLVDKVKRNGKSGQEQPKEPAKYYGGEVRLNNVQPTSDLVHAAVVTEGVNLSSGDLSAVGVLQKLMGPGPVVKYGGSRVGKNTLPYGDSAVSCINASYSDSGLFGFQVAAPAKQIGGILEKTVAAFSDATKGAITEEDVQRGKNQLRMAVASDLEQGATRLEDLALQLSVGDTVLAPADIDAAISKVTLADVQRVAKKVITGKPTMAAVGNLTHTPNLDQLL